MNWFRRMSLQMKLIVIGTLAGTVTVVLAMTMLHVQNRHVEKVAVEECLELARADISHIVEGVYNMCATQHQILEQRLAADLRVAREWLNQHGGASIDPSRTVSWAAVNQMDQREQLVSLPAMYLAGEVIEANADPQVPSPVVDKVRELVGGTCTIFQRMNDAGDMLRVVTNVMKADGKRAIGTYIPAVNPDGTPNPVIRKVMAGETYSGRAFVVDSWYLTCYEPLRDDTGTIIGMLYVGVPLEGIRELRDSIMRTKVGETGYVYVLNATGSTRGHYVISRGGEFDGKNILDSRDANGRAFIREIVDQALEQKPGEIREHVYPWRNDDETKARMKIAHVMYYEPWDWVIAAGAYEDEFLKSQREIAAISRAGGIRMLMMLGLTLLATVGAWYALARGLGRKIGSAIDNLRATAGGVREAAQEIAQSATSLAEGANQQASNIEETRATVEFIASMTERNSRSAQEAHTLVKSARQVTEESLTSMQRMREAIDAIKNSSDQMARIIRTIDEIAFQTNLLALNAAVEAARAGEAGKGFAVVAGEVRSLAQRSAEAARNTAELIAHACDEAAHGVEVTAEVQTGLDRIAGEVERLTSLVSEVAESSGEQARGLSQVTIAVQEVDRVTQSNAAGAEQSAAAGQTLMTQATQLGEVVDELKRIVAGAREAQGFIGGHS